MFETSVVPTQTGSSRGRVVLLTASISAHSAILVGVVAVSIASVNFPRVAPDEYQVAPAFVAVQIPPPLGVPNGGRAPAVQPAPRTAAPRPDVITAPSPVPDTTPTVEQEATQTGSSTDPIGSATEVGPVGVPWGVKGSIGDLDAPPAPIGATEPVPEKVYQAYEVKPPVLVHKVEPRYPRIAAAGGISATVVVRCIIDRNGNVRDPEVVVGATMAPFNQAVLDAVSQWRFTPGSVRGEAVDSYFNLTVRFAVKR